MFQTLSTSEAADLLKRDSNANWSYSAAHALVEYLEEIEEGGEPIEFDAVAIRCDWSEYPSALEAAVDFGYEAEAETEEEEKSKAAMLWLCDRTTVIEFDGGVVVCAF
jgi:hypothetical protein